MFRIVDYEEGTPLYRYISSIASGNILDALDKWAPTELDVAELYKEYFAGEPLGVSEVDFFEGVSHYIHPDSVSDVIRITVDELPSFHSEDVTDDGLVGMEFLWQTLKRMKEKMADPEHYYTFNLFEEYLFTLLIEHRSILEEGGSLEADLSKDESETIEILVHEYGFDSAEALDITESLYHVSMMGIDDSSMFFWDTDSEWVFTGTFIEGIRKIASGSGAFLGYGYKDICSIFTDIGMKAPLLLVGSQAGYDIKGEVTKQAAADLGEMLSKDTWTNDDESDLPFG